MPKPAPFRYIFCAECGVEFGVYAYRVNAKFCGKACQLAHNRNIMRHVDQSGGPEACWPWTSGGDGRGMYGRANVNGKTIGAHVAVYQHLVGPIPSGHEIDHLCRNPICCNPAHMEPVTRRENVLRQPKVIAARSATHCRNGHLWTHANTYIHPTQGSRVCRTCTAASVARYQLRKGG